MKKLLILISLLLPLTSFAFTYIALVDMGEGQYKFFEYGGSPDAALLQVPSDIQVIIKPEAVAPGQHAVLIKNNKTGVVGYVGPSCIWHNPGPAPLYKDVLVDGKVYPGLLVIPGNPFITLDSANKKISFDWDKATTFFKGIEAEKIELLQKYVNYKNGLKMPPVAKETGANEFSHFTNLVTEGMNGDSTFELAIKKGMLGFLAEETHYLNNATIKIMTENPGKLDQDLSGEDLDAQLHYKSGAFTKEHLAYLMEKIFSGVIKTKVEKLGILKEAMESGVAKYAEFDVYDTGAEVIGTKIIWIGFPSKTYDQGKTWDLNTLIIVINYVAA